MPFVGLTGGMGAGKSTALAALERLGAAVLSSDAVVHELYAGEQLREAVRRALRRRRGAGRAWSTARGRRSARSPRDEDRAWLEGVAVAARRRPGRRLAAAGARADAGRRGRRWSRCRCCSRRASRGSTTRRSRWSPRSACAASGPRARARARGRARGAPALPGGEGAPGDVRRAQRRQRGGPRARAVGGSWQAGRMSGRITRLRSRALGVAALVVAAGRRPCCDEVVRNLGAAAQRCQRHPRTGRREAPGPGADRGGDLRRDEVRSAPLPGRRAGADADPAGRPPTSSRTYRAAAASRPATWPPRASTWPTAATTCATCSTTTAATRCSRWPPTTAVSPTSTAGWRRPTPRAGSCSVERNPVCGDARIRAARAGSPARVPRDLRAPARHQLTRR